MLDPLTTTSSIDDAFVGYLRSSFGPRSPSLRSAYERALVEQGDLSRGPFVQATAPFESGRSVRQLVAAGVLSPEFQSLEPSFPLDRPLHLHQDQAITRSVAQQRNLVVSTGTGSGKTEAFLLPVLDHLMRERTAGTLGDPGVRALLLYPMNALANDQVKRLRAMLVSVPDITFGRYTGETAHKQSEAEDDFRQRYPGAELHPNELISRDAMKERPPHLLLTNYAMLEYLLLRPEDTPFFDGDRARSWKFLVLDEAHVYNGAQGTEVAYLIRRLRDRILKSERGRLRCFATSATLGRGREDNPQLVTFAEQLFDEPFEWDDAAPNRQDVISATRLPLISDTAATHELPPTTISALHTVFRDLGTATELASVAGMDGNVEADAGPQSALHTILRQDANVLRLQEALSTGSVELKELADSTFPAEANRQAVTVQLIDLCVNARSMESDSPLLPARYHHFVRSLEGAFVCLHPDHPDDTPQITLKRGSTCQGCEAAGRASWLFELATCRHCRAEYLVGVPTDVDHGAVQLKRANEFDSERRYYLLGDAVGEDDDDQVATDIEAEVTRGGLEVCVACGCVNEQRGPCRCATSPARVAVSAVEPAAGSKGAVKRCAACAGRAPGEVLFRFVTGTDAPVSVVATALYQNLPESTDDMAADQVGQGRKLLAFSDSRQDAAFFAGYLERTYGRSLHRSLIWKAVSASVERLRTDDVIDAVLKDAENHLVLDEDDGRVSNRGTVAGWMLEELLAIDRRQSLEGTGLMQIRLAVPRKYRTPAALISLGLTEAEGDDLLQLLLGTLRSGGAISALEGVDIRNEQFAPRNREFAVRERGSEVGVLGWIPAGNHLNRRVDILRKVLARLNSDVNPVALLSEMWEYLTDPTGPWSKTLAVGSSRKQGAVWKLDSARFEFVPLSDEQRPFRCDRCAQLTWLNVVGACPAWRCEGTLVEVEDVQAIRDAHYARLYADLSPIALEAEEHTAQWTAREASSVQDKFVRGDINVLSCSTTFEMGVDVGDVQAVLLRNVPPAVANYVQRAGRAGRRTDAAALVVTYAQRRNHDRNYYDNPHQMIDGFIATPSILLDNVHIGRRHAHSVAIAQHLRHLADNGIAWKHVGDYFAPVSSPGRLSPAGDFHTWLDAHPDELRQALTRLLPVSVAKKIGVDDWGWLPALLDECDADPTFGWFLRAEVEVIGELEQLQGLIDEAVEEQRLGVGQMYQRLQQTIRSRPLINYLASRNVLPKYGFPVDVVELNLRGSGHPAAGKVELTRDLKLAISNYAPGGQVVAAKRRWVSTGLARRPNHAWPTYGWAECGDCGAFRRALAQRPEECHLCSSTKLRRGAGKFIIPIYGFVGTDAAESGETRPVRTAFAEPYFSTDDDAEFELVDGVAAGGVQARMSRQGRITMINQGGGAGYRICSWCGFGEPAMSRVVTGKNRSHTNIRRVGTKCEGMLTSAHLGHEYLTDVLELKLAGSFDFDTARSVLYALIESSRDLGINREELDGTLFVHSPGEAPGLVLFDAVPGGAGHSQRIAKRLPELIGFAHQRVDTCSCGRETSCYGCLRGYSNQRFHESLNRGLAADVLAPLLGG